jgi:hypothetical protein
MHPARRRRMIAVPGTAESHPWTRCSRSSTTSCARWPRKLRSERDGHTLCTTALVHEAWLELTKLNRIQWQNRAHFLAVAAQAMRRICEYDAPSADAILEHARRAGLPVDRISEVALEINPAMFM